MLINYRFSINGHVVKPIYGKDLKKDIELESQQRFFREKLSKLTFIREDYQWIKDQDFDTEYLLLVQKNTNDELTAYSDYFKGRFYETDCDWNDDDLSVTVSISANDSYNKILAGMQKEFNLIELAPATTSMVVTKRPMIQVYVAGESSVACFLNGDSWEQDANVETDDTILRDTYHFNYPDPQRIYNISGLGTPSDCTGGYVSNLYSTKNSKTIIEDPNTPLYQVSEDGVNSYDIRSTAHGKSSNDIGSLWIDSSGNKWLLSEIRSVNSLKMTQYFHNSTPPTVSGPDEVMTYYRNTTNQTDITYQNSIDLAEYETIYKLTLKSDDSILFYSKIPWPNSTIETPIDMWGDGGVGVLILYERVINIYARFVLDLDTYDGTPTFDIPEDDIVPNNRNYKKVIPYTPDSTSASNRVSTSPTEYGKSTDGNYYMPPDDLVAVSKFYPLSRSLWGNVSFWFNYDDAYIVYETEGRKEYTLRDNYRIHEVLKVILKEVDPSLSHFGTASYSKFLYDTDNPISSDAFQLFITPKSNILHGEYDQPAQKAPISLEVVLDMLKNVYQCYWFIENNMLKIEHISWFKNGRSYDSYTPQFTQDLTNYMNRKNGKPWGFNTSKYKYEKQNIPSRMKFSWADDVSLGFEGYPIDMNSNLIQEGNIEDIQVSGFSTDIDYMLLNPSAINPDGFALCAAFYFTSESVFKVPLINVDYDGVETRMQNGWLSWIDLHPKYWRWDLPVRSVEINNTTYFSLGVKREKIQSVKYPSVDDPEPLKLVKTYIGDGEIRKISINLTSRMNEIQLNYDTE